MKKAILVTGPAGSGKTARCVRVCSEALGRGGPGRVIYLVPSTEAVREVERELLLRGGRRGILGPVVTDFVELALRILKEAGCFPLRRIRPIERRYLILRIIRETPLRFFESVRNYEGFADVVADFIAELKRGMISPEDFLEGALGAEGQGGIARDKVQELHVMYRTYHDALATRGAYDGEGLQWKAAEALGANASLLSGVETLLVDGFATYTPVEFEMLTQLVGRVGESHITLCYEEGRPEVFTFVGATYARLKRLCTAEPVVLSGNHRASGALCHLERAIFAEQDSEVPAGTTVGIVPCSDVHRELETVAREMERIRKEEGLDYSDFMVIFRDVRDYLPAITEVFGERRIPLSLATGASLAEEPFIRALVSALRLAKGEFQRENVLAVLKNSYLDADKDAAAAVENYADEFGLWDEKPFRQTWTEAGKLRQDVGPLNDFRTRFLGTFDQLRARAEGVSSAEEFRQFVFDAIRELGFLRREEDREGNGVDESSRRSERCEAFSSEYRSLAALDQLLDTMCEYDRLLGLGRASYGAFLEMMERGLAWMPLPPSRRNLNSLRVSPIVGGPPSEAAVVFVCGLCERSFPREILNEPFFKDRERRFINRRGTIVLDERLPLSSGERFFFYVAVTRATRRLVLTYPAFDRAGEELVRSHYVEEVARVFSDLKQAAEEEAPVGRVVPEFKSLTDVGELRCFIAHHLSRPIEEGDEDREEDSTVAALTYNELRRLGILEADHLVYRPTVERLSDEVRGASQERNVYLTSVSELETFARCPFRHFCEYRLRLKELPRYEFGPAEEGMLYHEVLAGLYREIYLPSRKGSTRGDDACFFVPGGIESVAADDLEGKLTLLVDEFIHGRYSRLFRSPRMAVRRRALLAKIKDFVFKEVENERVNATRPAYFELSFGRGKSQQNADSHSTGKCLSLRSEEGPLVRISGRMDRVDIFKEGEEKFGVVLDYKRSAQASGLDLGSGTVLQPGLYMLALEDLFGLKAAGAFYYFISSARKRGVFATEEEERIGGQGDVSKTDRSSYEEIRELMERNARQALEYVRRIMEGEISIRPADEKECRSCPFGSICRIKDRCGSV